MLLKTKSWRGNGTSGSSYFRHQQRGLELPTVENGTRGYVAARRGRQQQDRNRGAVAAIRQSRQKVILERLVPMPPRARRVAEFGEQIAHAAVRVDVVGADPQGGFEMDAGLVLFADEKQ